jgi:hypothetical protein
MEVDKLESSKALGTLLGSPGQQETCVDGLVHRRGCSDSTSGRRRLVFLISGVALIAL